MKDKNTAAPANCSIQRRSPTRRDVSLWANLAHDHDDCEGKGDENERVFHGRIGLRKAGMPEE